MRECDPVELVCQAFDIQRSSYYDYRNKKRELNARKVALKAHVNRVFTAARSGLGSSGIHDTQTNEGIIAGRYLIRRLMKESGLICKQHGPYKYTRATIEHIDIPNRLNRQFDVQQPNKVWCGDITYILTGRKWW